METAITGVIARLNQLAALERSLDVTEGFARVFTSTRADPPEWPRKYLQGERETLYTTVIHALRMYHDRTGTTRFDTALAFFERTDPQRERLFLALHTAKPQYRKPGDYQAA